MGAVLLVGTDDCKMENEMLITLQQHVQFRTTTLKALINALEECNPLANIEFDFCNLSPSLVTSCVEYEDCLSLGWNESSDIIVRDVLADLDNAIGKSFWGWRKSSSKEPMRLTTAVFVDKPNRMSFTTIKAINSYDDGMRDNVVILTETLKL